MEVVHNPCDLGRCNGLVRPIYPYLFCLFFLNFIIQRYLAAPVPNSSVGGNNTGKLTCARHVVRANEELLDQPDDDGNPSALE